MIFYLEGLILNIFTDSIVINVSGIGYKVFIASPKLFSFKVSDKISLYIYQNLKEDSSDLFGFSNIAEREFFEKLISVKGVGPKSASGILIGSDINILKEGITKGDVNIVSKIKGIGKKTAERIILELAGKLSLGDILKNDNIKNVSSEAIAALMTLGFSEKEARDSLDSIDSNASIEDQIKQVLKR
jgi:Holliday junction DNA helicase RuvA